MRFDYIRTLEIFLLFEKVNGKHMVGLTDFYNEFDTIFIANPETDRDDVLNEMMSLDLIKQIDADHILGEEAILLLDKGLNILEDYRKMQLNTHNNSEIEHLIKIIFQRTDRAKKESYIQTLDEINKCYKAECYTACIALCGKTLEILFYELINNSDFKGELYRTDEKTQKQFPRNDLSLWKLRSMASRLPNIEHYLLPENEVINTITAYRNASIHFIMTNYKPSKRIADGIIHFLVDTLEKYFTDQKSN